MLFNTIIRVKSYQSLYKNLNFNFIYYSIDPPGPSPLFLSAAKVGKITSVEGYKARGRVTLLR